MNVLKIQKGTVIKKADRRKEKEEADQPYLAGGASAASCQVIMGWEGDITNRLHIFSPEISRMRLRMGSLWGG